MLMASMGIEAIAQYAEDGTLPQPTEGKDFFDTGVQLVTDEPVEGVESISVEEGRELCWG
jgi:fructose transport system substrate-binding protein